LASIDRTSIAAELRSQRSVADSSLRRLRNARPSTRGSGAEERGWRWEMRV
jgi:hypothetical protein